MSRFQGILLPSGMENSKDETEVRKMGIDLLKNDNILYEELIPVSGSNSNGSWVKFPNGTMMQWGITASIANSIVGVPVSFPISWLSPPVVTYIGTANRAGSSEAGNTSPSVTTEKFNVAHGYGTAQPVQWFAIGIWK